MIKQMKARLEQLEGRLRKVVFKHKEIHSQCFPKDGSDGVYKKVSEESYEAWENHPLNLYMDRTRRVSNIIRREMLAIIYYIKIMETRQGVYSLIDNTINTINKYRYLFDDKNVDLNIMFPKTDEEIKRAKMSYIEKMEKYPEEQSWSMFSKEGNLAVTNMMIDLIKTIHSETKVTVKSLQEQMKVHIDNMCNTGHGEVHDTAVRESVLCTLDRQLEKAGYAFTIDEY